MKKLVSKNKPSSQWLFINCLILISERTWEEPAPVPETPQFWWSLFWVCRCRGGKEGWCRGRGLWAPLASCRWRRRMEIRKQNLNVWFNTFNNWWCQTAVGVAAGQYTLWLNSVIISLLLKLPDLVWSPVMTLRNTIKEGVCVKATQSSLCTSISWPEQPIHLLISVTGFGLVKWTTHFLFHFAS